MEFMVDIEDDLLRFGSVYLGDMSISIFFQAKNIYWLHSFKVKRAQLETKLLKTLDIEFQTSIRPSLPTPSVSTDRSPHL